MMNATLPKAATPRSAAWKWWVCGLLLLATMLNYMDRLTLNLTAKLVRETFGLNLQDYGQLESAFAVAFAVGSITFGWLADRVNVRWLYPLALLGWSAAGFTTGMADSFAQLLLCRFWLGLFEGSNWACALRTTQRILSPAQRAMGNSVLQSGAALGSVITPLLVIALVTEGEGDGQSWRAVFIVVGCAGITWIFLWLPSVRSSDLALAHAPSGPTLLPVVGWVLCLSALDLVVHLQGGRLELVGLAVDLPNIPKAAPWLPLWSKVAVTTLGVAGVFVWLRSATQDDTALPRHTFFRRYWVLVVMVVCINTTWHFLRAWLPPFLQEEHHYSVKESSRFFTEYYIASDIGSLSAGFCTLMLARRGWTVFGSRTVVFLAFGLLALVAVGVPLLSSADLIEPALLVTGCGALGVYPMYYAFSQELTTRHQGKVTGCLGCTTWLVMALLHEAVGDSVTQTHNYTVGFAVAGVAPLVGLAAVILLWRPQENVEVGRVVR